MKVTSCLCKNCLHRNITSGLFKDTSLDGKYCHGRHLMMQTEKMRAGAAINSNDYYTDSLNSFDSIKASNQLKPDWIYDRINKKNC